MSVRRSPLSFLLSSYLYRLYPSPTSPALSLLTIARAREAFPHDLAQAVIFKPEFRERNVLVALCSLLIRRQPFEK